MTPNELEDLLKREGETLPAETENVEAGVQRRVALLTDVLEACKAASSPELELLAEKLGDGSRNGTHLYNTSGVLHTLTSYSQLAKAVRRIWNPRLLLRCSRR